MAWTPTFFEWDYDGDLPDNFQIKTIDAGTSAQYHGVGMSPGGSGLTQVGNHWTLDAGLHGFNPPTTPDHVDVKFTVQAAIGVDSSAVAVSPVFQFRVFVATPFNLTTS